MCGEKKRKTIGVLTSGGDAPGMNAAIRAVVRESVALDMDVFGVRRGYNGLIEGDLFRMHARTVSDIMHLGGTILYTARCEEFRTPAGVAKAKANCEKMGIEGLVVIGGDGTFRGARELSLMGLPCVGVPGTIDNDIASTDYTIGFDTALNTAIEAIDKLRDTSQSHSRCSVVEVMGNKSGHLAVAACAACGGFACWTREQKDFDVDRDIVEKMKSALQRNKRHFIIIVSENLTDVHALAKEIQEKTGVESRATVLGHIQRGGSPTAQDRIIASRMGHYAVNLLYQGIGNRVVVERNSRITDFDILEALAMKKEFDEELLAISRDLSR